MRKIRETHDINGTPIRRGDVVATLSDNISARIGDICRESDTDFVLLRAQHQAYSRGCWQPADRVQRITVFRKSA